MKKLSFYILGLTVLGASSCIKESSLPERFVPVEAGSANVKFLMMSPDASHINFYVSNVKATGVAPSSTGLVQGVAYPSILPATTGYAAVKNGNVSFEARVAEASTTTPGAVVFTESKNIDANKFYTYVLMDSLSKLTSVLVEDDPVVADQTKAYIRVGNFVSNNPTLKIDIVKTSTTGAPYSKDFGTVAMNSVTNFEPIEAGTGEIYRVYLRNSTTNAKLDSISAFTPSSAKKYTIYARGVFGLTGTNTRRPIITSYTNF